MTTKRKATVPVSVATLPDQTEEVEYLVEIWLQYDDVAVDAQTGKKRSLRDRTDMDYVNNEQEAIDWAKRKLATEPELTFTVTRVTSKPLIRIDARDVKYCSHCNGYGSSLKEESDVCTACGGSGRAI